MTCIIEYTQWYFTFENSVLKISNIFLFIQLILHQESDNSAQLSQVYDMVSSSSKFILHNY
jgi:hypothetical protein